MKTKKYLDSLNIILNHLNEQTENDFEELIYWKLESEREKLDRWTEINDIQNLLSKRVAQIEFAEANPLLTQHIFYHAIVVQHELLVRGRYYNPFGVLNEAQ